MSNEKQLAPIEAFKIDLAKLQPEIKKLLPEHITIERFERVVLTAAQMSPRILECDKKSLFNACLRAASDGLLPDGREGAIVPYGSDAQWMPMVYGIFKKMRNSGEVSSNAANIVHKNDKFKYWVDDSGEHIMHEPDPFSDRGEAVGVYSMVNTKDGSAYIDVMSKNEVMAARAVSKSKNNSPWEGPFKYEMWKKTSVRRLSKRVPMSAEVERVIQANDDLFDFSQAPIETKAEKIQKLIKDEPKEEAQEQPQQTEAKEGYAGFTGGGFVTNGEREG